MPLTEEQKEAIANAINERFRGNTGKCPLCGKLAWNLADGLIPLTLSDRLDTVQIGGRVVPVVALVCSECGNTMLVNVLTLGLGHLFESTYSKEVR